ncbi:TetR family transcriptional regulator [Neobacillus niacini]|uniref:TetR/AcrR family transcriptional regulator n=1 Tax=Neobacillus niacini TaxID=86668 RepID=UPI002FFF3765
MPRIKEQYQALRTATKNKIHSASIKLFAKKRVAATSVQDIADTAGISTRLLYPHYKTKVDLFNEVVSYATAGLEKNVETFKNDSSPV